MSHPSVSLGSPHTYPPVYLFKGNNSWTIFKRRTISELHAVAMHFVIGRAIFDGMPGIGFINTFQMEEFKDFTSITKCNCSPLSWGMMRVLTLFGK